MEDPIVLVVSAIIGIFIGILSGLLGIGGGTVMVPLLRVFDNYPALMATGTSLLAIIPTSVAGAITHIRNKTCVMPIGLAAGLGGAVTSVLGVQLASISPSWLVMAVAAVIIMYSAYSMLKKARKAPKRTSEAVPVTPAAAAPVAATATGAAAAPTAAVATGVAAASAGEAPADAPTNKASEPEEQETCSLKRQIILGALIGCIAGVASGYVGVGGGFLMVPLFLNKLNIPMKKASGTSLIAVCILAIPAVMRQFFLGNVSLIAGLALAIGAVPGATIGARFVTKIPERTLRYIFSVFLGVAAVLLITRELGLF